MMTHISYPEHKSCL